MKGSVSYYSKQVFPRVYIAIIIMYMNSGKNLRKSSYIVENERIDRTGLEEDQDDEETEGDDDDDKKYLFCSCKHMLKLYRLVWPSLWGDSQKTPFCTRSREIRPPFTLYWLKLHADVDNNSVSQRGPV